MLSDLNQNPTDREILLFNSGDLSIDYHIQESTELRKFRKYVIDSKGKTFLQVGNAAFTGKLLIEMGEPNVKVNNLFTELKLENAMTLPRSFSIIRKFGEHKNEDGKEKPTWRIAEYLHRTENKIDKNFFDGQEEKYGTKFPDILVLSDYNARFRNEKSCWPKIIIDNRPIPITFFRCSYPFGSDDAELLHVLLNKPNADKKLIIVTTIDDLRLCNNIKISQGLSWEKTAEDLVTAINCSLTFLTKAAYLVVTINRVGALLFHKIPDDSSKFRLFYSNEDIEENDDMGSKGSMHGLNTGLMLHVIKNCVQNLGENNEINLQTVTDGISAGLKGITNIFNRGFLSENDPDKIDSRDDLENLHFPTKALFGSPEPKTKFEWVDIPISMEDWSICNTEIVKSNEEIIQKIILEGDSKKQLGKIPYSNFGDLLVVGKRELEESREIKKLLISYSHKLNQTKPLSIAVFGEPGAGKSHTIEKMAESLFDSQEKVLKFNLSQLTNRNMLNDAFHQIQDARIGGKTVIVFWDEFDSSFENEVFGWTKHFLSPMQDGTFNEGSMKHAIGQSIFFFIASKYKSLDELRNAIPGENDNRENNDIGENTCTKILDFLSRLQGHIDIPGINPRELGITYELKLRRATLFRFFLEKHCPTIIDENNEAQIDPSLIKAFMEIEKFNYGARSMEAIISMSHVDGTSKYTQSCLPSNRQLSLHVKEKQFWKHLKGN